jgi:LAO/AO transport system kinase
MTTLCATNYVDGVLASDRSIVARAVTLIESSKESDRVVAREVIRMLSPHSGKARRIGITGVPGAGKSTLLDAWGKRLLDAGARVAVLAVDPTSVISGGSILGDKTRMPYLSAHPNAFVRPSPSGLALGGVARRTREAMLICEAAGYEWVFVETVGVGQSEVTVSEMVDFFLVLAVSGAGDELQGIKRGIFELADAVLVHKSDGDNRARAQVAKAELSAALRYAPRKNPSWSTPVLTASSLTGEGLDEVEALVERFFAEQVSWIAERRLAQASLAMWRLAEQHIVQQFRGAPEVAAVADALADQLTSQAMTPEEAALALCEAWEKREVD